MQWKPLFAVLIGLLIVGMVAGNTFSSELKGIPANASDVAGYENQISTAKLYNFLKNNLSVSVNYQDLISIQRITPGDIKQARELKASGLTASEVSILRLIKKIQLMEFVASKSGGNPEVIIKLAKFLGDSVISIENSPVKPMSGDYSDLLLDIGCAHFYQSDPEIPYYVMVWGNYLWRETENPFYEGSDDVVYYIWDEADDLVLFKDVYASPEMKRAGSALGAIAYYTPDRLHSGYVRLYFVPKTSSVSGRWTRVSMTYVHTYGIQGTLSVTVGYKFVQVTYQPRLGGKWKKSDYVTFRIDPEGALNG